jgi:cbb3-type cytochrome oxidase cytochrome c subunit
MVPGVQLGPALNGMAGRRTKEWIEVQIRSPKRHSPETTMPGDEMGFLCSWLA